MREQSAGFTLTEIMVVIIIIGILAVFGVPKYEKTVETSKADEAVALLQLVYSANKMYMINNCPSDQDCYCEGAVGDTDSCESGVSLVSLNYIPDYNDPERAYEYYLASDNEPSGVAEWVACAKRRSGSSPGTDITPYTNWKYKIKADGSLCGWPATAPLPSGSDTCSASFTCS